MSKSKWIIIGAGELGKEIYNIFFRQNSEELAFFIDNNKMLKSLYKKKVYNFKKLYTLKEKFNYVLSIGNIQTRKKIIKDLSSNKNLIARNLIAKNITFLDEKKIGKGNIFYPYSNINFGTKISNFNIFQFNSSIGHNTKIGNNCFIGSNTTIQSNAILNNDIFLGANAIISGKKTIKSNVNIGPSTYITKDIKSNMKVINYPRYILSKI